MNRRIVWTMTLVSSITVPSSIATAGRIVGWGYDFYQPWGETNVLPGNDFTAIAAGGIHGLALRSDGSLAGWFFNDVSLKFLGDDSQTGVPSGNDFVAIAAGGSHSLALRADGTLAGWGLNGAGQADVPAGNDFVAISAGGAHSLALRANGSLIAWGINHAGQTDAPAGNEFVAIAAGGAHNLALRSDGSLAAWGINLNGEATAPAGNDFVAIAAGSGVSLALKSDGSLVGWGSDYTGITGVPPGSDYAALAVSIRGLALEQDGSLKTWGHIGNDFVPMGNSFVAIATGGHHLLAIQIPEPNYYMVIGSLCIVASIRRKAIFDRCQGPKFARKQKATTIMCRFQCASAAARLVGVTVIVTFGAPISGEVIPIVSPSATANAEGNQSVTPTPGPVKIQMLFPASDFAGLPDTHRFLVAINFRGDRTQTEPVERVFPDKNIWISTTDTTNLSTVFADNHGADKTLVQDGMYSFPILGTGPPDGPRDFAEGMRFQKPFYYDPSQGNLLVEQSNDLPFSPNPQPVLDQQSTSEFTFLVGSNPDATSGNRLRILAVMQFEFAAPPPGDFNLNGIVDAADYTVWRDETRALDAYQAWQANFGQTAGGDATLLSVERLSAVPEPTTFVLTGLALMGLFGWRKSARLAPSRIIQNSSATQ